MNFRVVNRLGDDLPKVLVRPTTSLCMLTPDYRYRCQIQCRPQRTQVQRYEDCSAFATANEILEAYVKGYCVFLRTKHRF